MGNNLKSYLRQLLYSEVTDFQVQKLQVRLRLKLATTVQKHQQNTCRNLGAQKRFDAEVGTKFQSYVAVNQDAIKDAAQQEEMTNKQREMQQNGTHNIWWGGLTAAAGTVLVTLATAGEGTTLGIATPIAAPLGYLGAGMVVAGTKSGADGLREQSLSSSLNKDDFPGTTPQNYLPPILPNQPKPQPQRKDTKKPKIHTIFYLLISFCCIQCQSSLSKESKQVEKDTITSLTFNPYKEFPFSEIQIDKDLRNVEMPEDSYKIVINSDGSYHELGQKIRVGDYGALTDDEELYRQAITMSRMTDIESTVLDSSKKHLYTISGGMVFTKSFLEKGKLTIKLFDADDYRTGKTNLDQGIRIYCEKDMVMDREVVRGEYCLIHKTGSKLGIQNDAFDFYIDHYPVKKGDNIAGYFYYKGIMRTSSTTFRPIEYWGYFKSKVE